MGKLLGDVKDEDLHGKRTDSIFSSGEKVPAAKLSEQLRPSALYICRTRRRPLLRKALAAEALGQTKLRGVEL